MAAAKWAGVAAPQSESTSGNHRSRASSTRWRACSRYSCSGASTDIGRQVVMGQFVTSRHVREREAAFRGPVASDRGFLPRLLGALAIVDSHSWNVHIPAVKTLCRKAVRPASESGSQTRDEIEGLGYPCGLALLHNSFCYHVLRFLGREKTGARGNRQRAWRGNLKRAGRAQTHAVRQGRKGVKMS